MPAIMQTGSPPTPQVRPERHRVHIHDGLAALAANHTVDIGETSRPSRSENRMRCAAHGVGRASTSRSRDGPTSEPGTRRLSSMAARPARERQCGGGARARRPPTATCRSRRAGSPTTRRALLAREREPRGQHVPPSATVPATAAGDDPRICVARDEDHAAHQSKKRLADSALPAGRDAVGDEGPVAKPAVLRIGGEGRARGVGAHGSLQRLDGLGLLSGQRRRVRAASAAALDVRSWSVMLPEGRAR